MTPREAGRELDALIAEKVMGAVWEETPDDMYFRETHWLQMGKPGWTLARRYADGDIAAASCPYYSTDIAAAWLVVEKVASEGAYICVERVTHKREPWNAWVGRENPRANTAPLAICLAALAHSAVVAGLSETDKT